MGSHSKTIGRIIVSYPTHPAFLWAYLLVGIVLALLFSRFPILIAQASMAPYALPLSALAVLLIVLSPPLSFVNMALARIKTGAIVTELGVDYVEFFGIPIPIPRMRTMEVSTILAINVGGAVVPILASTIFTYLLLSSVYGRAFLTAAIVDVTITSIAIYLLSRPVAGVGIVVPAFTAPLIAAFVAVLMTGFGVVSATAAYIGGSIGSLLGADVFRLSRSVRELKAPMLSIGGAGMFDGVFLSGILAFALAL
ncbi:MAG: DUF1614 domain-containing protein [Acidilobus sp.]